ncbi:MAG: hypothetical protein RMI36_11450 [Thermus sp.]|uniref:hypothetical protein n=1 Tax=Thermus sp. TaxID=275 RepID=UPI0025DE1F27|nr:hypothetical protein [Thermus sp.]MCS6867408.1 hypothetical protein [Thermus sp.]MDW8018429.1 hypothetical protein [Thermus sp.]MDW8358372.1 hypothetical protein [Thermus sp.]
MPRTKRPFSLKALLSQSEWRHLAAELLLEPPERPKPRFRPWRGRGKGVRLDAVLQDLRR